jgi:hypothetical protein
MKKFKQIDVIAQLVAIIGGTITSIVAGYTGQEFAFLYAYFAVGGLQLISFFGHLAAGPNIGLTPGRRRYGIFLLVTVVAVALGFAAGYFLLLVLFPLLFAAPIAAICYCNMCYNELKLVTDENK